MLLIDGIIFSLQKSGGISVYFSEIIKRLGFFCGDSFMVSSRNNDNKVLHDYNLYEHISNKRSTLPLLLDRYLDVFVPKGVNVFHSSYYRLPMRFNSNVKVITTVHDFTYEYFSSGLKSKVHHIQKKRALLGSDVIVCISENTKRDMYHFIPETKRKDVRVIYNGVSDDFYRLPSKSYEIYQYVMFVGARSGYKNFSSLVLAVNKIQNMKLIVVGGGDLSQEEKCFLEMKLKNRYEFKGFVSNDDLNKLYNNAFCLVYPSLYEGFGIPAIEAMKSGCPVIASNTSSLPEICGNAAILIDDISVQTIQFSIEKLFNAQYRAELIQYGYKNAERFSWDRTFESLKEIYFG